MPPKAILFDLDDTIITSKGGDRLELWKSSIEDHIHLFPSLKAHELFEEVRRLADIFWLDADRHEKGRLNMLETRKSFVRNAAENLNSPNAEAAVKVATSFHERREYNTIPFHKAIDTLEHFRQSDIKTALITNGGPETQRAKINTHKLEKYFDLIVIEGEFGIGKPNHQVYTHILTELDEKPEDTWIVGDNLDWEVRAPQELGFYTIWNDFKKEGLPDETIIPHKTVHSIFELIELTETLNSQTPTI